MVDAERGPLIRLPMLLALAGVVFGGLWGAVAWTQRDALGRALVAWAGRGPGLVFAEERAPGALEALLRATGAEVALATTYDVPRFSRRVVYGLNAAGRRVLEGADERPITAGYSELLGRLLAGEVPCFAVDDRAASDTKALSIMHGGLASFCVAGVPPGYGLGLAGTVGAFFKHPPPPGRLPEIHAAMRSAAASLVSD